MTALRPVRWAPMLALGLLGCPRDRTISEWERNVAMIAGRAAPFDQLAAIDLGMTRTAVQAARPRAAARVPALLVETLYGDTVTYEFDRAGRLVQVAVRRVLPARDAVAAALWQQIVQELAQGRARPGACYRSADGTHAATWAAVEHAVLARQHGGTLDLVVAAPQFLNLAERVPGTVEPCP